MEAPQPPIRFGVFQVDLAAGELRKRNARVKLQQQPFQALAALLERPGEVVTREEIQRRLWPSETAGDFDRGLTKAIARVREALGDDADNPRFIETLPQRGYRFLAPVEICPRGIDKVEPPEAPSVAPAGVSGSPAGWRRTALAGLALLALIGLIVAMRFSGSTATSNPAGPLTRFRQPVPEGIKLSDTETLSLSPDGRTLVYLGIKDSRRSLWLQSLDSLEPRALPDTDNAVELIFWSPDSQHLYFASEGKLKRLGFRGDPAQVLGQFAGVGGSANAEGTVIFGTETGTIQRIDVKGGEARPVTTRSTGERTQLFPFFLPDGRHFLYSRLSSIAANTGVYIGSLDVKPGEQSLTRLIATPIAATFVGSPNGNGTILFQREARLWAQDFDTSRLQLTGQPRLVAEPVGSALAYGFFSASPNALVYRNGIENRQLTWFDRQGKPLGKVGEAAIFMGNGPGISPDGSRVATSINGQESTDIWAHEVARDMAQRMTFDPALDEIPKWSPDGKWLVFSSARSGHYDLYETSASGDGHERLLHASKEDKFASGVSPDGRFVLYTAPTPGGSRGIWVLSLDGGKPAPVVWTHGRADESEAVFSPDSRWIAFVSNESGRREVYAKPFSGEGPTLLISNGGGSMPHWRADGKEILYRSADGALMSAAVIASNPIRPGVPRTLFHLAGDLWDATADGTRFLVEVPVQQAIPPFTVVLNWQAGLAK